MGTASTMSTGQFREFAGAVLRSLPDDLDSTVAQEWIENQDSLRKVLRGVLVPEMSKSDLLEVLGTVAVPVTEKFVAKENFIVNTGRKAPVKISYVGSNFSERFLGKVEKPKPGTQLRYAKLLKSSVDRPILAELGNAAETALAEIFHLMATQPNGEDGALLNNGYANIFYVRDVNGELRAVNVNWNGDGWNVNANSVANPNEWCDGNRVFS